MSAGYLKLLKHFPIKIKGNSKNGEKAMTNDDYIKKFPRHASTFMRGIPSYLLNEISPIFQKIDFQKAKDLVLFDVGGNHGLWTASFLSVAGHKTIRVEVFEPLPGNISIIKGNMNDGIYGSNLKSISLNEYGISNENAVVSINYDTDASGFASMSSDVSHLPSRNVALNKSLDVSVRTIDSVCDEKAVSHIDILKIDIEGYELFALEGARKMFERKAIDICIFEFGPHQLAHRHLFRDFYKFFDDLGYNLYKYRQAGAALIPITEYMSTYEMYDRVNMFLAQRK